MFLVGQWVIGELQATGAESQYYYALNQCITEERSEVMHLQPGTAIPFADVRTGVVSDGHEDPNECKSREYCGGDSSCPDGERCPDPDVAACRVVVTEFATVNTQQGWTSAVTSTDSEIHVCEETADGHCNQWGWQIYGWPDGWHSSVAENGGNTCVYQHAAQELSNIKSWNTANQVIKKEFDTNDLFGPYDAYGKFGPFAANSSHQTNLSTHCLQSIEFYKQYLQVDYMIKMTVMLGLAGIITVLIIRLLMSTTALGRS